MYKDDASSQTVLENVSFCTGKVLEFHSYENVGTL